jgi:hypothetical protein
MKKEILIYISNGIILSLEKEGILLFATMYLNLEGTMLSKISQAQKGKSIRSQSYVELKKR